MKKNCFIILLVFLLAVMGAGNILAAADDIKVYVDGAEVSFPDQKPMINADSRTLVPVRFVSEALGADVEWDGATNTVNIAHKGKSISLVIGQKQAKVDENSIVLDTAAALVNSRTMVPLRFVSECLGAKVEWNGAKQEVYITTLEFQEDKALINSDLILRTPPGHRNNVELAAIVDYCYDMPIAPQMEDLRELVEKRLGSRTSEVMDYAIRKTSSAVRLERKEWLIDGMLASVSDSILGLTVTIWINGGPPKR